MSRLLPLTSLIFLSQVSPAEQSSTLMNSLDSACGQGANLSGLVDKAQKRTPPELLSIVGGDHRRTLAGCLGFQESGSKPTAAPGGPLTYASFLIPIAHGRAWEPVWIDGTKSGKSCFLIVLTADGQAVSEETR
jgi:hypothetical protein